MNDASGPDVVVLGAGAAGMLCATRAAMRGRRVLLLEKNRKAAVKVLMSGGTRCNLTHDATSAEIADAYARLVGGQEGKRKAQFLRSALASLSPDGVVALFEAEGVATKVEATGKVFPVSDRALDVQRALLAMASRAGVTLALGEAATDLRRVAEGFVVATALREVATPRVVVAVGGQSYPGCGTTGDGYAWATALGHRVVPPRPALVPLTSAESWSASLQGVTLPDVRVRLSDGPAKAVADRRGSFLFTHFGLSGPAVMDSSRFVSERPDAGDWRLACDFVPGLDEATLAAELQSGGNRGLVNVVAQWAPRRLAEALVARAGAPPDRRLAELAREERLAVVEGLKRSAIPIAGSLGFKKAEVTAGGVDLAEVNPRTMESRLVPGAYFVGEVLDLDGPIGGYNFQAAFSTGALAGDSL